MAQSVEHVIGNDEVISSILITSSKKASRKTCFFCFSVVPIDKSSHILTEKEVVTMKQGDGRGCFAELGSMTYAMKAQKALANAAIPCIVQKTESSASHRGCTYGIRFSCLQENNVRTVLSAARIPVKQWKRGD